jgi:hypothetical protein
MKELIRITDKVYVNETDVATLEYEAGYSDYWGSTHAMGTIIVMKSGRKVFAEGLKPAQVLEKLRANSKSETSNVG